MEDYLIKAIAFNGEIRAYSVRATQTVAEAQRRHDSWNTSTAALGRTMIGAILLGAMLKGDERLTVRVQGDGPAGAIVVDSNGKGEVKGYIQNPNISLPLNANGKIDVRGAVGTQGTLSVTKDLGLKEPFTGQVPLVSGELGEDFTFYLANSEQVPSAVGLSVLIDTEDCVTSAGGFMLQVMPGASEETLDLLEERLAQLPLVSQLLANGKSPEEILEEIIGTEHQLLILEEMPVQFKCDCSKEKFGAAILTLGPQEIQEMIEEDHGAEAVCHFCGNKYQYSEEDLLALKKEAMGGHDGN